jgi:4-amino-4-deoxy-L-arabinose transferase-like glycosyltransferase
VRRSWLPPATTGGVVVLLGLYALVHVVLRLTLPASLGIDDARETLLAQTLAWGYLPRQPPLYNWLVWGAFRILGVGAAGLALVKYGLLFLTYLFVYLAGRRLVADPRLAALGALSLWAVVPLNWVVHEELTHSVAALAAAAASFHVGVRLVASGYAGLYLALGVALALGLLAKLSFALFGASLLLALLSLPEGRRRLARPEALLTLGALVLLPLPYVMWFAGQDLSLRVMYVEEVQPDGLGYLPGVASGLYYLARMVLYYVTPLWLLFLLAFGRRALAGRAPTAADPAPAAGRRLLVRLFLAEGALLLAGILVGGVTYLKFRWLVPAFFLLPLVGLVRLAGAGLEDHQIRRLAVWLLAVELVVVVAFAVNIWRGDRFGRPTRLNAPYDEIAAALRAAGFRHGTIVAGEGPLGGNLRLHFPDSRVIRLTNPDYLPPEGDAGSCVIVWAAERDEAPLRTWVSGRLGVDFSRDPVRVVEAPYRFARTARVRVSFVLLPEGRGRCR